MTEDTTLTDEQIAEIEQRMADCEHTDGDLAFVVEALRTSTERVKELESIMTTWNQEELDEAEKRARLTKTLFDQAERVKVLEEVAGTINEVRVNNNPQTWGRLLDALKKVEYLND